MKGGERVGSGQKGVYEPFTPIAGGKQDVDLLVPPDDLPEDERDFWQRYAAVAVEKGTLTVHTVAAWRLLCEVDAEKRQTRATMNTDGRTFLKVTVDGAGVEHQELKAHPLTSAYGRLAKACEALMARFGLAPFGKPEPGRAKPKATNAFREQVG